MCRMIVIPNGAPGGAVLPGFVRMAEGKNALNDKNRQPGAVQHGDGWGALVLDGGRLRRVRSTHACWDDPALKELGNATVVALHARRASQGASSELENVHPFSFATSNGTLHFMHNGTVRDPLVVQRPLRGATDSERYFAFLLDGFEGAAFDERVLPGLIDKLCDYTALNAFLISEGRAWVIALARHPSLYYTLHWQKTDWGTVVASEPLADLADRWFPMAHRSLTRFGPGEERRVL